MVTVRKVGGYRQVGDSRLGTGSMGQSSVAETLSPSRGKRGEGLSQAAWVEEKQLLQGLKGRLWQRGVKGGKGAENGLVLRQRRWGERVVP